MDEAYLNLAIRRQAILERLKSGEVKSFAVEIKKLEKVLRGALLALDDEFSTLPRRKLNNLLRLIAQDQATIFTSATTALLGRSADIAAVYMAQELLDLNNTIDVRGTKLNAFTKKDVFSKVVNRPLATDGDLLKPWLKKFTEKEVSRVSGAIRMGHSQGLTNQEMVQRLVGSKARGFKDGILQTSRRNASTVVRTSVQHVASAARQEVWEANQDVVKRYQFIATLDRSTSNICKTLDNQIFDFGRGPIPPVHPNAVPAGELVTTKRGLVAIECVKVGDLVLTHLGRWQRVNAVMSRDIDEKDKVHELKDNFGSVTRLTNDHPVLCRQRGWQSAENIKAGDVVFQNLNQFARIKNRLFGAFVKNIILVDSHNIPTQRTERLVAYKVSTSAGTMAAPVKLNKAITYTEICNKCFNLFLKFKRHFFRNQEIN